MKRQRTILVVEDNAPLRKFIVSLLKEQGYRTLGASDAQDALEIAARPGPIHALLSDIILSGPTDGLELGNRIRRLRPGIRVMYMSGYAGTFADRLELESLCDFFLAKPFTSKSLFDMVEAGLAKHAAESLPAARA